MVASTNIRSTAATLLEPENLAKISKMELIARQLMDGYVQGLHRSPHIGVALDFAQHRQYVPGDDVKRIDWRAFAKTERYYIKQYEQTTNLQAHIVLDASGSMSYRGTGDALSKFRYARCVAACLAYLVIHQQDSASLITFDSQIRQVVPSSSAPSHLMRILQTLDESSPREESGIAPMLHDAAERLTRRGLVIVISDLFDDAHELIQALHHLRHRRHEVILLQTMANDELEFPFSKWSLFENLERSGDRIRLDPATMRNLYLENVAAHLTAIRRACSVLNFSHLLLDTGRPFDEALMAYLTQRNSK